MLKLGGKITFSLEINPETQVQTNIVNVQIMVLNLGIGVGIGRRFMVSESTILAILIDLSQPYQSVCLKF